MPPPIRYPLPTMAALLVLALVAWRGAGWARGVVEAVGAHWRRAVEGPPVPASTSPRSIAGPIARRALLLRDGTPVAPRPDAKPTDAIARRMFVDVYDTWPVGTEPTHYRVGNRRPIGWVSALDAFAWDTRLVVRPPDGRLSLADRPGGEPRAVDVGPAPVPVVGWRGESIEVLTWKDGEAWSAVGGRGWTSRDALPASAVGVLLAREELSALLPIALAATGPEARLRARLRALFGRVVEPTPLTDDEAGLARDFPPIWARTAPPGVDPSDRIAARIASETTDAAWGGHAFRFVPLDDLP